MTVHLPWIGVTSCQRAKLLLESYPQNIAGSFWIMCDKNLEEKIIPDWWIDDIIGKKNQAQTIIDRWKSGNIKQVHNDPLFLSFCILVVTDPNNPANFSYVIQHLRMLEYEGISLLRIMAKHDIPVHTEVSYPKGFLQERYGNKNDDEYQHLSQSLEYWSVQVWEDYCSYLMAHNGQRMFASYCYKANGLKAEVKATLEKSSNPLVLTEGETDPIYIKTALELFREKNILENVEIEWVGSSIGKGKIINTGYNGLNNTRNVLISNPQFLNRKVLLLYDCDTNKANEDHENLKVRQIPKIKDRKVQKGIENLLPDHLFKPEFYVSKTKYGDYGEENHIQEFQKIAFCKWICEERRRSEDFKDFKVVIDLIKDCLGEVIF